jgi:hypothetical protein
MESEDLLITVLCKAISEASSHNQRLRTKVYRGVSGWTPDLRKERRKKRRREDIETYLLRSMKSIIITKLPLLIKILSDP